MKKWLAITLGVAGTVAATTAIVAPVTWACVKPTETSSNESTKYISVADMFKSSKLYANSSAEDKERLMKQYDGIYVLEGSKTWKKYNNTFNPKGGS